MVEEIAELFDATGSATDELMVAVLLIVELFARVHSTVATIVMVADAPEARDGNVIVRLLPEPPQTPPFVELQLTNVTDEGRVSVTTALVTASEKRRGFKNSTYYFLDIKYKLVDTGEQYSAQTISWKKYAAGDTMPLMYLTNDPGNFKTDFGKSLKWLLPFSIILIGLILWFVTGC